MQMSIKVIGTAALAAGVFCTGLIAGTARAEILAMVNYETKSADSLKTWKLIPTCTDWRCPSRTPGGSTCCPAFLAGSRQI